MFIDPDVLNKDEAAHNIKTQPCILCSSLRREKSELVVLMDYNSFTYITGIDDFATSLYAYRCFRNITPGVSQHHHDVDPDINRREMLARHRI